MKPQINIRYGKLLDPFFKEHVLVKYPTYEFPTEEQVLTKVKIFQDTWKNYEDQFIESIKTVSGLSFKRSIIDCFIVSATPRDMSAPLIIRSRYDGEEFADIIMHELLHILLSDNKVNRFKYSKSESERTLNHLSVFALLNYFYIEILKDEKRLLKVKQKSKEGNNSEYARAWEIVEEVGYENIIDSLKVV